MSSAIDERSVRRPRILLIYTGSVATVKVPQLFVRLQEFAEVLILASSCAGSFFLDRAAQYNADAWVNFERAGGPSSIVAEEREWAWEKMGDPVFHIELRKWADLVLIAPASADFLAKLSGGVSDTLALSVLRAWDVASNPCILCPAMNTLMWLHPTTSEALARLTGWGYQVVHPVRKELACKDVGLGAMADVDTIINCVKEICTHKVDLASNNSIHDKTYFVTAPRKNVSTRIVQYAQQHRSHILTAAAVLLIATFAFSRRG